jgi:hypothetical protein
MKRDEPQILADLIRLHTRMERAAEQLHGAHPESIDGVRRMQLEGDMELIEQARAALHKYVVAAGRKQLDRKRGAIIPWWPLIAFAIVVAIALIHIAFNGATQ